ncbi:MULTISPECIES: hypothetical protein [unclassified Streptomyces]|uniref:hypothetical protein n=1 Tax=unclassified Streptomyces TaxID=2593676 RepID=UPI0007C75F31|nr:MULTISPECIES: hypothetical protein [unclassified Streptomyces]
MDDRYFVRQAHRDKAVTVTTVDDLPSCADLQQLRQNVLLRGGDVDSDFDRTVELDSGDSPVMVEVNQAARRRTWTKSIIGPGAQRALPQKGGVRSTPMTDGAIRVGRERFRTFEQLDASWSGCRVVINGRSEWGP